MTSATPGGQTPATLIPGDGIGAGNLRGGGRAVRLGRAAGRAGRAGKIAILCGLGSLVPIANASAVTYSFAATYSGQAYGLVDGVYYDDGGYGIAPDSCPSTICVFSSLPAQATVSGMITTTLGQAADNTPQLTVTERYSLQSSIGSTSGSSSYTTDNVAYVPSAGSFSVSFPSQGNLMSGVPFGSAGGYGPNPSFTPAPNTSGTVTLNSGAIALNAYAGAFLPGTGVSLPDTLLSGTLTSGTISYGPTTPPPTVQQLEAMNADFYNSNFPSGAGSYRLLQYASGTQGFSAAVYSSGNLNDGGQVVIIPQATAGKTAAQAAYEFLADLSWVNGTVTNGLDSQVNQFAKLVSSVASQYPNSQITLSGYSLGGGIAQIVGNYANVQTVTFDSPGARQFLPSFSNLGSQFAGQNIFTPSNGSYDYRLEGDEISTVGTQVGQSITVINPLLQLPPYDLAPGVFFTVFHALSSLDGPLVGAPPTPGDTSNTDAVVLGDPDNNIFNQFVVGTVNSAGQELFSTQIQAAPRYAAQFDPPPGYEYTLLVSPGSPDITSLSLPVGTNLSGEDISAWKLFYATLGGGFDFLSSADGYFTLPSGVDLLDFYPTDPFGNDLYYSDPFIFQLTFSGPGTFSAELDTSDTPVGQSPGGSPSLIPEPPSWLLLTSALLVAAATRLRSRAYEKGVG